MEKLYNVHRVSTSKVNALQKRMKEVYSVFEWREGLSDEQVEEYFVKMVHLLRNGQLRYWAPADSYVLFDFSTLLPRSDVFCISRKYFHEKIVPRLYSL